MRIAPILVPYTRRPDPSMYADAAIDGMLTHNSYANNATCVAYVHILWNLLSMSDAPEPEWWVDTFCSVASELEGETKYKARYPGLSYEGPLRKFVDFQVRDALRQKLSVKEACYRWGSGANLFETVPSVLYILATHSQSTEEAMVRAVNDAKDNDTTAAIVGAAVGALHGSQSIPKPWLDKLTGRTGKHNDGEVFKRILNAKHLFCLGLDSSL